MKSLVLALAAMFMQQTFAAIGKILPAVIAPAIILDLHFDPAWIGAYFGVSAFAAILFQMTCGGFIVRYGALRVSQAALVMLAFGMAVTVQGSLLVFIVSAVIGGGGAAVSTPASSHLLGRYSPPQYAPLVFSIKQTAVPAGLLLAGFLGPLLTEWSSWRGAMLIVAAACFASVFTLEPLREKFDSDRMATQSLHVSDLKATLNSVLAVRDLRRLSFACFAFNAVQTVLTAYFVIYLTTLGYTMAAAGFMFSLTTAIAMPGRILWGWIGSVHVAPRVVMAGLAFGMAASAAFIGLYEASWPALVVGIGAGALSATALSWHGVLLSETARLAPEGNRGAVTGVVLSFGQLGAMLMPVLYSVLLGLTGSYGIGFIVCGLPALLVGFDLLRSDRSAVVKPVARDA
ncbi:MAG TPA: MFS transporter [Burkholderiales bacterium]|nr:MFS transporter [Burkholderiales bacterium]